MRGEQRLLPDGLGRQRPAHRAPGPELLRRPLRPVAALRPRLRAARQARPKEPGAGQPAELRRAVRAPHRRRRAGLRGRCSAASACRVDWAFLYTTIGEHSRRTSQRAFLRNLARGEAYQQEAPTLWDVDFRTAVAQAELEDRELPGAYHTLAVPRPRRRPRDRHDPPGAAGGVRGARGPSRRRALPAACSGRTRPHAAVRRRGARPRPPAGRSREGHRHRHDLHVRRPHRRHLVAGAGPAGPADRRARRPHHPPDARLDHRSRRAGRATASWPARP